MVLEKLTIQVMPNYLPFCLTPLSLGPMDSSARAIYSLGAVARVPEVPPGTLRSWSGLLREAS
jgi:hypothetical protein